MKKLKVGINGFGRIGRIATRIILNRPDLELVAINSMASSDSHAYLLKYDSAYGILDLPVESSKNTLLAGKNTIDIYNANLPDDIPWNKSSVDIVIDSTGKFRTMQDLEGHRNKSVNYVVLSSPSKDDLKTIVMGVNQDSFDHKKDFIVSNSSCTTNCLAIVTKVIESEFGIKRAFMTTTHSVTDSQNLLDNSHKKEIRLRRSALQSMIPASTGSAKDIIKLYPHLAGRIICQAIRIPTASVSMINLVAELSQKTDIESLNSAFYKAANSGLKNILKVAENELVSVDYKGFTYSAIYDRFLTSILEDNLVNLYAWYDNEWGYTTRLVDLVSFIGKKAGII